MIEKNTSTQTIEATKQNQDVHFPLGDVYMTPGAMEACEDANTPAKVFLDRHAKGDWGDLSDDDKIENDFSVQRRLRIFSAYHTTKGVKLWVITEADRSATTILLPDEY